MPMDLMQTSPNDCSEAASSVTNLPWHLTHQAPSVIPGLFVSSYLRGKHMQMLRHISVQGENNVLFYLGNVCFFKLNSFQCLD